MLPVKAGRRILEVPEPEWEGDQAKAHPVDLDGDNGFIDPAYISSLDECMEEPLGKPRTRPQSVRLK